MQLCRIYHDTSLGISNKILSAVDPNSPVSALPKSSHLETRVYGILRQLEKAKSNTHLKRKRQEKNGSDSKKNADEKIEKQLGEETLVVVRKLRTLQRKGMSMNISTVVNKTRKYMEGIGNRIDAICQTNKAKLKFWDYVSRFTENSMDSEKLKQVYDKLLAEKEHGV